LLDEKIDSLNIAGEGPDAGMPYSNLAVAVHRPSRNVRLSKTGCSVKIARIELLSEELMDALSLTRERVRVWV
jgi:hypothetical protein